VAHLRRLQATHDALAFAVRVATQAAVLLGSLYGNVGQAAGGERDADR
jgi:hypothetical protein